MAATRNQQPTYDFLTGGEQPEKAAPQSRIPTGSTNRRTSLSMRQSISGGGSGVPVRASLDNEALRAQINTLRYELESERQSRGLELESLRAELREAERRADTELRRSEAADKSATASKSRLDAVVREGKEKDTKSANERAELERKIRNLQDGNRELREEVEDAKAEIAGRERETNRRFAELEQRYEAANGGVEDVRRDADAKSAALNKAQERLADREKQVGELENEVLRLKAQSGDKDTLEVIKRELAGQVGHIRNLEKQVADQAGELRRLRRERKAVEVAEEEKRALEAKLGLLDEVRRELAEAQLQRRILEDEKRSWTSYLENENQSGGDFQFSSPEEMARALVGERVERLSLVEQLGKVQPEISVREEAINSLEEDKARLEAELKKAKVSSSTGGTGEAGDSKVRARLERQRNLAVKEVEYLRAQLKSLEDETTEFDPSKADEQTSTRTAELESLVDEYKAELQTLHAQLKQAESHPLATDTARAGTKRPASPSPNDHTTSDLRRKLRTAQTALSDAEKAHATLAADLAAAKSQIIGLQASAKTRVLELRSNPTATYEATKAETLRVLRAENAALRSAALSQAGGKGFVAASSVAALENELAEARAEVAQRDKKTMRLKSIWGAKAQEFTSAISSVLGWNVVFLPQGKLKLSSTYYPKGIDPETGEEEENFILFDGEQGTMKISGGERSRFAREIREMVEFWVEGRGEVPLFLAACGLEFWER
ncbi:hypothetical protein K461DRAFT_213642, partial [Myriangium duriaei CBS 260.36]